MESKKIGGILQIGLACVAALMLGASASAELVNIDLEGDPPDTTHSGSDGVLSGGGTVWNGVDSGVDALALLDEAGSPTTIDVVFSAVGGGVADGSATNDLQDSGTVREFTIRGLSPTSQYDVAVYAMPFSFLAFTDSGGLTGGQCVVSPTYVLPGTPGSDYCLFEDRTPQDLGGGDYGFTITPADGVATGVQLLGPGGSANVPALPLLGILGLVAGLLGVGAYARR